MRLFNSVLEVGVRTLLVLEALQEAVDVERLVVYDYLVVHSADFPSGPPSLHAATPYRSGQLAARRDLIQEAISFLVSKGLAISQPTVDGFRFTVSDAGIVFCSYLSSTYASAIRGRSTWLASAVHKLSDSELRQLVRSRALGWGADTAYTMVELEIQ